ncbi:MAG: phosphate ABC transporter ATP-binding protein [Oscillospiraceae bacterium]|nr:phosphate ABC transporter ATP-binding protein [Oscillospiraceae bacterium]
MSGTEQKSKISIRNLNFYYLKKPVIHNLNLEVPEYAVMSLIGPANSGITTLLRSLNRLTDLNREADLEGEILIDGVSIHNQDISVTELRRRIGIVFDVPAVLPMSIFDNIAYGPRLGGIKNKKKLTELAEEVLCMASLWDEIKDRLNMPALRLSGGQQQRLCIARALALKPEVLLLDRPCASLDPISTAKIEESLVALKEKFTILISPHTIEQARRISDRVAFMLMGSLVEEGLTEDIFVAPRDNRTDDYISGRFG